MKMIPIVDKYKGLVYLNPTNVCYVSRDWESGDTRIIFLTGVITTIKPIEEVKKLIEQAQAKPQGVD